jgi:hypothetical protein
MDYVKLFDDTLNERLSQLVRKPTLVRGIVHLLLILYSARLAPTLPKQVMLLFENQYFKLFVFSLILWTAQFSPSTSILIAIAFMVTVNYSNQRPLWEMLENMEEEANQGINEESAPEAPSKEMAVEATAAVVNAQVENTPVVTGVSQKEETIIVQPKIVDTPQGPVVVNPTIVIAPVVVETPSGEKMIIKPDVSNVKVDEKAAAAVMAGNAAPAPAPVPVAEQIPVAVPEFVFVPAPEPVPAPAPAPAPSPAEPKEQRAEPAGCYPIRRYDMQKVSPQSMDDYYGSWSA